MTATLATPALVAPPAERFHALDALRAFALLLGIVFHAALAYCPLPAGYWAVNEPTGSPVLPWVLGYCHLFRMPVFFLLAGFFAHLVIQKRGPAAFLRDRGRRILLVFLLLLYPMKLALGAVWISGGLKSGWLPARFPAVERIPFWQLCVGSVTRESFPNINLTHLWFLYYLSWIYALVLAARAAWCWLDRAARLGALVDRAFRRLASGGLAPVCFALLVTPLIAAMREPGVDTPDGGFLWHCPVLALYCLFFLTGWLLHRQADLLPILARRFPVYLPASLLASVIPALYLPPSHPWVHAHPVACHWIASAQVALTMALAVPGWIGLFLRLFARPTPAVRYVADSSYWLYLAHLPLVVALQVWCFGLRVPWGLKLLMITAVALVLLFFSYHFLVRCTWLGLLLNGHRAARPIRHR